MKTGAKLLGKDGSGISRGSLDKLKNLTQYFHRTSTVSHEIRIIGSGGMLAM